MNDLTGALLDQRYQVVQFVGRGGMAVVYKVWDTQRSVYLAMKVLNEDLAEDEIFLKRFKREAETLSRLQHPFIIRSYGLVQTHDLAFLLMDFIEGITLRKEIFNRKAPWPPDQILAVMRPVCAALNFAHTQGLVHCDVKPANIMLTGDGKVLLADFGIARVTESATTATLVGAGTPAYMAPEQIQGKDPLPQTDIYALGIVLFELLTGGERPFTGEHAQTTGSGSEKVRWEQVHRDPPSVRSINPEVSSEMEAIVFKCLEKDSTDRYSSTMEMYAAIERAYPNLNGAQAPSWNIPVPPPPVGPPPLPPKPNFDINPPQGYSSSPIPSQPVAPVKPTPVKRSVPWWMFAIGLVFVVILAAFAFSGPLVPPTPTPTQAVVLINTEPPVQPTSVKPSAVPSFTPVFTVGPTLIQKSPTSRPSPTAIGVTACTSSGQSWLRPKDKSMMQCVPAGSFPMGYPNCKESWCENEAVQGNVDVAAFWIDRDEITNAQFQQFVSDTGFVTGAEKSGASAINGKLQPVAGANWHSPQGSGSSISGKADHPVVQMNWFSADAYCQWAGGRLPSEAEWEKAARGTDGRLWPWGNDYPDPSFLNANTKPDGFTYTAPVGSFSAGDSPYGLHDMAGNAFEWTRSLMKPYPYSASDGREMNTQPGLNEIMVLRGGDFFSDYGSVRSTWRPPNTSAQQSTDGTGFRCVIDR
jgi:eukaryotic-like serine/threonine-protein kinase